MRLGLHRPLVRQPESTCGGGGVLEMLAFEIPPRYSAIKTLESDAGCSTFSAKDENTGFAVCIKKCVGNFQERRDTLRSSFTFSPRACAEYHLILRPGLFAKSNFFNICKGMKAS